MHKSIDEYEGVIDGLSLFRPFHLALKHIRPELTIVAGDDELRGTSIIVFLLLKHVCGEASLVWPVVVVDAFRCPESRVLLADRRHV